MTTIASFTTPEEAHLFRTFLESNGIWAVLRDEHIAQLFWHYSNAVGGVRVEVADEDAEEAAKLCSEYMAAIRSGPDLVKPARAWPVVLLVSLLFGAPFLLFGRRKEEAKTRGLKS